MEYSEKQAALLDHAVREFEAYKAKMLQAPKDKIFDSAYTIVMKQDILSIFEEEDLPEETVSALAELVLPLDYCYDEWLSNDCSHMQDLRDTIKDAATGLQKKEE